MEYGPGAGELALERKVEILDLLDVVFAVRYFHRADATLIFPVANQGKMSAIRGRVSETVPDGMRIVGLGDRAGNTPGAPASPGGEAEMNEAVEKLFESGQAFATAFGGCAAGPYVLWGL